MDIRRVYFCKSYIFTGLCNYNDCTQLHYASQLTMPHCNCKDKLCRNFHPDETRMSLFAKNLYQYTWQINKSAILCKFGDNCLKDNCKYAHNSDELIMVYCKDMCDDPQCTYRHNETREEYFQKMRSQIKSNKRKRSDTITLTVNYRKNKSKELLELLSKYKARVI